MKRLMKWSRLAMILAIYMACASYGGSAFAQRLAAGGSHTCTLSSDGVVRCWGNNSSGQLGNRTRNSSSVPVIVNNLGSGLSVSTGVTAGSSHTCLSQLDNVVRCWGNNSSGQLGNGTNTNSNEPVTVSNLGGGMSLVTAIDAGALHTCALMSDGVVRCWGNNTFGQLGNGTNTHSNVPVTVSNLGNISNLPRAIAAGYYHTCVLLSDGSVKCWGRNYAGQLGNGTNTNSNVPVLVSNLGSIANLTTAIAAGGVHTCAFQSTGAVKCWGRNNFGELGDGSTNHSNVPVTVTNLGSSSSVPITVTAGGNDIFRAAGGHTCTILANEVKCWGGNVFGQLGNGTTTGSREPVTVNNLGEFPQAVAAGNFHTCALLLNGTVRCWGRNFNGQLGNGNTNRSLVPVSVVLGKKR